MSKNNNNAGISIPSILTIVFIVLKLCKVINWSWWWVLLPTWGGIVIIFLIFCIIVTYKTFK
ncbi:hypothetical protein [Pedobacter sp. MW01-1-1]|uniref:hypothetical protein n=1 Tax=Pedobacter sp. MW01-1-1 TaxID=3383027 RepID=UPI003FEFD76C